MGRWLPYLIGLLVLVALAPIAAGVGRRYGRSLKGGLMLSSLLLGFGRVIDPPAREAIEEARGAPGKKGPQGAGDPPPTP